MQHSALPALLVLLVVVVAGCTGSDGVPEMTTTTDVDPTGTTGDDAGTGATATPSGDPSVLAPGVTTAGIVDVDALLTAHSETLLADGARIRLAVRTESVDGTVTQASTQTVAIGPAAAAVRSTGTSMGPDGEVSVDTWLNDSLSVFRFRGADETTYEVLDPLPGRTELVLAGNIGTYLRADPGAFEVDSTAVTAGRQVTTLQAAADLVNGTKGDETEMRVAVDDRGAISRFELDQRLPEGDHYRIEYELEATGVTPDRPAWVEAIPAGVFLEADLAIEVDDGRLVVVSNAGPDAVPADSTVTVVAAGSTYDATLDTPLGPGETRWLWVDEASGTLRVATVAPEDVAAVPLGGQATVVVRSPDGVAITTAELAWREAR
jgi:hypothetical protein